MLHIQHHQSAKTKMITNITADIFKLRKKSVKRPMKKGLWQRKARVFILEESAENRGFEISRKKRFTSHNVSYVIFYPCILYTINADYCSVSLYLLTKKAILVMRIA